jgi:hypothetical protein
VRSIRREVLFLSIILLLSFIPAYAVTPDDPSQNHPLIRFGINESLQYNGTDIPAYLRPISESYQLGSYLLDAPSLPYAQTFDPTVQGMDRPMGPLPAFETSGAYIIFLLTFGISISLIVIFAFIGRRFDSKYYPAGPPAAPLAFASGYLILGIVASLLSIPLLSLFTALLISGNPVLPMGLLALSVVYLVISSFVLAYASYSRRCLSIILAFHPVIASPLVVAIIMIPEPLSGLIGGGMAIPLIFCIFSVTVPLIQMYLMKQQDVSAPSSMTMVAGADYCPIRIGNRLPEELNDRYMDAELVGSGGMAYVFRARRRQDGALVAVKVPTRYDEVTGHSFIREMDIWKSLTHPNIVLVFAYNILPVPYVEMEYISPSLAEIDKPMPPSDAVMIIRGIAEGLAYAHASGVIHRDIKPGNILIAEDGTPKITDWGLGKEMADQNETRYIAFSLDYASPEQISPGQFGRGDERIDIFQLGMVFYELLTGKKPFDGEGMGAVTIAIMTRDPEPPSMVEATLRPFDAIIQKCLRKDPDDRYRSVREFISDLDMVACTNRT